MPHFAPCIPSLLLLKTCACSAISLLVGLQNKWRLRLQCMSMRHNLQVHVLTRLRQKF